MRIHSECSGFPRQTLIGLIGPTVKVCDPRDRSSLRALLAYAFAILIAACSPATEGPDLKPDKKPDVKDWKCVLAGDSVPDFSHTLGCVDDFTALASTPPSAGIPVALAVKTVVDRAAGDTLYFPNTIKYDLHYNFVSEHLSGNGRPLVPSIPEFGLTEYYSPDRRFILGTLLRYSEAGIWVWELTPSDNAGADLIALAYGKIADACFCGKELYFHPTSLTMEAEARKLPASVKVLSAARLSEAFSYHPFNNATGIGKLAFATAQGLRADRVGAEGILVLDSVPDRFPMASGLIIGQPQAVLSAINVQAREHGIPNMSLRGALGDSGLRALEGKWVKLTVDAFGYSLAEATESEAQAWRDAHKPAAVNVPEMDTTAKELRDVEDILEMDTLVLAQAVRRAVPAYGGTAGNYSVLTRMDTSKAIYEKSFAIPVFYYRQHMRDNGLDDSVDAMLADSAFKADPGVRERRLASLREAIQSAPIDPGFWGLLNAKLDADFPGAERFLFLSSSNAEALDGFTGAGLYESRAGVRSGDPESIRKALLGVWAGVWSFNACEERIIRNIDHKSVGMGMLVREERRGAEAVGEGITVNPYDPHGYQPGFYVNVRAGEASGSEPVLAGALDQYIYHYTYTGKPIVMLARADLSPSERPVLTAAQNNELGNVLLNVYLQFQAIYWKGPKDWYGMDAEFKLARRAGASPGDKPGIIITRVGPYRGWGQW